MTFLLLSLSQELSNFLSFVICDFVYLAVDISFMSSQTVVHAQGALQLLDNTLVKGDLLPEVGLHHVFEVHLSLLMEVAHLCLEGKTDCPAALPNAVCLILVHPSLISHPLTLLHLGKGTYDLKKRKEKKGQQFFPTHEITAVTTGKWHQLPYFNPVQLQVQVQIACYKCYKWHVAIKDVFCDLNDLILSCHTLNQVDRLFMGNLFKLIKL